MRKILFSMVAVVVLAMSLLVGCGGGAPATLEGTTWEITNMKMNGQEIDVKKMAETIGAKDGFIAEFKTETTGVIKAMGNSDEFDYEYKDGKLTLEGETYNVGGDTIVMEKDGDNSLTMKKK